MIERPSLAAHIAQAGLTFAALARACRRKHKCRLKADTVAAHARGTSIDLPWIQTQAVIAAELGISQDDVLAACRVSREQHIARVIAAQEKADREFASFHERRDDEGLNVPWGDE